jgi:hypothetical protein
MTDAYPIREYPQQNADGSTVWVKQMSDGTYQLTPISSAPAGPAAPTAPPQMASWTMAGGNQGLDQAGSLATTLAQLGLQDYSTRAGVTGYYTQYMTQGGPKTIAQMREELIAAGGGDWARQATDTDIFNNYNKTAVGGVQAQQMPTLARQQWLGSMSGPQDWVKYAAANGGKGAFGQMEGGPSWEQEFAKMMGNESAIPQEVRQPTSIQPQQWQNSGPVGQAMQQGLWSAQGLDPTDAYRVMANAWPTGRANPYTKWG